MIQMAKFKNSIFWKLVKRMMDMEATDHQCVLPVSVVPLGIESHRSYDVVR